MDSSDFESLFKAHYKKLCFYANTFLGDIAASEEIVSDTFAEVWERRNEIVFRSSVTAYLYKSVYNRSLNYLKHLGVKNSYNDYFLKNELSNLYSDIPSYAYEEKEIGKEIAVAIHSLPEKCKEIFELSRYHNKKYHEIAELLNISPKTVENQMGIALRKLREALKHIFLLLLWIL